MTGGMVAGGVVAGSVEASAATWRRGLVLSMGVSTGPGPPCTSPQSSRSAPALGSGAPHPPAVGARVWPARAQRIGFHGCPGLHSQGFPTTDLALSSEAQAWEGCSPEAQGTGLPDSQPGVIAAPGVPQPQTRPWSPGRPLPVGLSRAAPWCASVRIPPFITSPSCWPRAHVTMAPGKTSFPNSSLWG